MLQSILLYEENTSTKQNKSCSKLYYRTPNFIHESQNTRSRFHLAYRAENQYEMMLSKNSTYTLHLRFQI